MSKASQANGKSLLLHNRNFEKPDEIRPFEGHGRLELVNFEDGFEVGRGIFEPGWKWSVDVKPLAETESCLSEHHGYCISGAMVIHMNSGEEFRIESGEAFSIPPGHDAWVDGNVPCVLVDMSGFKQYAKKVA